jgi:hypothetical protein
VSRSRVEASSDEARAVVSHPVEPTLPLGIARRIDHPQQGFTVGRHAGDFEGAPFELADIPIVTTRCANGPASSLRSAAASSAGQAITRSGIITVPFVSGDTSKAQAKLSAPKHVPTIIGIAKPKSY